MERETAEMIDEAFVQFRRLRQKSIQLDIAAMEAKGTHGLYEMLRALLAEQRATNTLLELQVKIMVVKMGGKDG